MCFLRLSFWSQGLQSIGFVHKHHFVSRDVVFHEELFPFAFVSIVKSDHFMLEASFDFTPLVIKDTFVTPISVFDDSNPSLSVFDFSTSHSDDNFNNPFTTPTTSPPLTSFDQTLAVEPSSQPLSSVPTDQSLPDPHLLIAEPPLVHTRRSTRVHKPPVYLQDYSCNVAAATASSSTPYDIATSLIYSHLEPTYHSYLMSISTNAKEPEHFFQDVKDPAWKEAMHNEISALERNNTWVFTPLPPGKTPIGCKWVYKIKLNPDGSIERYKARLVAKGYTQREGLDFLEIFSPVDKTVSVRVILALAAAKGWPLY